MKERRDDDDLVVDAQRGGNRTRNQREREREGREERKKMREDERKTEKFEMDE